MSIDWVRFVARTTLIVVLAFGLAGSLVRAAQNNQFQEKRSALMSEWSAEKKKLGLQEATLYAKYPTPEIAFNDAVEVSPGATAAVSFTGKIPEGAAVLSEHDAAQLSGGVSGNRYTGKLTVAPGQMPGFVRAIAFTPVSGASVGGAVAFINVVNAFDLRGTNGWTIKLVPTAKAFSRSKTQATLPYRADFYRPNEGKPFETRETELKFTVNDEPGAPLNFSLREAAATTGAQAEYEAIVKKMSDPAALAKLSDAEQEKLSERFGQLMEQIVKQSTAIPDPAVEQKKQDDFGCGSIVISGQAAKMTGSAWCGKNVGMFDVTGTASAAP
jgi:hypothetical protein